MKKFLVLIFLVTLVTKVFSQEGKLQPDSSKITKDSIYGKFVYLKDMDVKVDSGYVFRRSAPMVFVGTDGTKATTDKVAILKITYILLPSKKEIKSEDIIFFKPKQ